MSVHKPSTKVLREQRRDAKLLSDCASDDIQKASCKMRGCEVRASSETNPDRIGALKESNTQYDDLCQRRNSTQFETWQRTLEFWDQRGMKRHRKYDRNANL